MRPLVVVLVAVAGLGTARVARVVASEARGDDSLARPYAPSPTAAPFVALGYRELLADLLYARMLGYFGNENNEAPPIAELSEAIAALDPRFQRNYDVGPIAMTAAHRGVDNSIHLRAIALLERAGKEFPSVFRYPNLAGQIYVVDLQTTDAAQRRAWDEKGALLLEAASRKPNAPADAGLQAAILQTRFGQRQRAIDKLRELILITDDAAARDRLLAELGQLTQDDAEAIAGELLDSRRAFERDWMTKRPAITPTFYVLLGKPLGPSFDLVDLATGGRDLITLEGGPSSP